MAVWDIKAEELAELVREIRAGDDVNLSGVIYTARDAAHKRLCEAIDAGMELPLQLKGAVIYYAGPTQAKPGGVIGSIGPTTSSRMDAFAPVLIREGLAGMIGKGPRSAEVTDAMREYGALYFAAVGGAGALISSCVESAEIKAYPELGCEALRKLFVNKMPLICACDACGGDLYVSERNRYRR